MIASDPEDSGSNVVPLRGDRGGDDTSGSDGASTPAKPRKRAGKGGPPANFFDNYRTLVDKYALIHGTDTAWDGLHRIVIKVAHMRLTYSPEAVKAWLGSPERKTVTRDQVVFDPTNSVDPKTHVNLFGGFELEPKPGVCDQTLALLEHLCGGNAQVYQWVLRWVALPLQRPGAKMATAIIMHGAEGTGKNLFWSAVQQIYGRYGTMIGQSQLDSDFNGWLSAKLFITGNEVLGRKEKWELKGALKHMVTEDNVYINEKNMPERVERNHANLVFLSNELQPLVLGSGDRRYLVVDCWKVHEDGERFYKAVRDELAHGGVEALYHHLLNLPLDTFGPHTKPIDTEAKRDLVELGKDEPERFLEQWGSGYLDLPCGAAAADHLYAAFRRWCMHQGERHVPSMTRFGRACKARLRSRVMRLSILIGSRYEDRQRTVYWSDDRVPETCEDLDAWIKGTCQKFADAAIDPRGMEP